MPPVPRYEEEEEEEDEDVYVPELPPDLARARANPSSSASSHSHSHSRRPIGPARGPLRREEEEESEDEIGPAPLPPPPAGAASAHAHEDAVIEFMQKEAQRRQAIEVRFCGIWLSSLFLVSSARVHACHQFVLTSAFPLQEAARPKTLKRDEWMLVPPTSSDLLSSAPLFHPITLLPAIFHTHIHPGPPPFPFLFEDVTGALNHSFSSTTQRSIRQS